MTSLGCQQDHSVDSTGGAPYLFKIHGSLYHKTGTLIPAQGRAPNYAQLYIYDPQEAIDFRINHTANAALHRGTMQILQDMLYHHHPGVQLYKQAFDLTRNIPANQQCRTALRFTDEQDRRHYNLSTTTELAVILPGDGDQATNSRDIVLFGTGGGLQRIGDSILSIQLYIMSSSLQLDNFNGIPIFLTEMRGTHSSLSLSKTIRLTKGRQLLSQSTSNTVYIHTRMSLIIFLWLANFFRNML